MASYNDISNGKKTVTKYIVMYDLCLTRSVEIKNFTWKKIYKLNIGSGLKIRVGRQTVNKHIFFLSLRETWILKKKYLL